MNQIGDKPEEVRRHREEEKRQAERKQGGGAAGSPDAERERVEHATPDEEAYSTFDAYEEPEDRP
ncbi:hypothetical protein BJP40_01675 [Streptomyces sp. CC53]|uniref:hypothetical protein n=1 Tax=unclassified Streptomyces TaxID=2593676 RepID=UPI0008DCA157|nr:MULTISPECIES: hypothetical protein [unclassified Streptomyces]OII65374.1 hypothetical protein BJP40_01675 [Streptomyces sp. CC53]